MVGTSLHNLGMPMIRYRTTDRTARKTRPCTCGRPLPLMEDVTTKAEDLLRLRDGRLIPPSVLTHPFKPLDCIEASQIVQTDLDRIVVRLIPRAEYTEQHGSTWCATSRRVSATTCASKSNWSTSCRAPRAASSSG